MTRLQKKCFIAVAGTHLLLVVVLLCSGFIKPSPKPDDTQLLDVIPANVIDQAFRSGVRGATPPPPTPIVQPQPQPPQPPQPQPPQPEPPKPDKPQPPEKIQPPVTKPDEPTETKPKPQHKIDVNLTRTVRKKPATETDNRQAEAEAEAKAAAKAAQKLRDARIKAIRSAARSIRDDASSSTTVDMPGDSTAAYADYASVVKTVYTEAWILPDSAENDEANVKVSVTIANDGRVTDAHIVDRSGDASVDSSVQRTLDRVRQIEPFPDGATDKERTYIINFNLKAKRQLLG
jgi:TonB family protein